MSRFVLWVAVAWLCVTTATAVFGQTPLPPQEIVDALKPTASRGAPAVAPPSLSLAIQFEPNSARVRPASGPLLGNLVAALLAPELQAKRFVIEGHGDAGGSAQAVQELSQQRADAVRLYLVALGVPAARLRAVGQATAAAAAVGTDGEQAVPGRAGHAVRVVAHE